MVITTSAARTTSSVHGLGYSLEMSMPRSAMAATAAGLISMPGSDPPDHATAASPARCWKKPIAIWERPALWVHRNSTVGLPSWALAFHLRKRTKSLPGEAFGEQRQEVGDDGSAGELVVGGVQEPVDGLYAEHAGELGLQTCRCGLQGQTLVDGQVVPHPGMRFGHEACRSLGSPFRRASGSARDGGFVR